VIFLMAHRRYITVLNLTLNFNTAYEHGLLFQNFSLVTLAKQEAQLVGLQ
jgi:hypothetical protein